MNFSEYQERAAMTAAFPLDAQILYPLLALPEEVGEVCGKVAKYVRKNKEASHLLGLGVIPEATGEDLRKDLRKEIGDVLWNVAMLCEGLGFDLCHIAQENLDKLAERKAAGTIIGEGDNR